MDARECRTARAWLQWKQQRAAHEAHISPSTLSLFEAGRSTPNPTTLAVLEETFQRHGIDFDRPVREWPRET